MGRGREGRSLVTAQLPPGFGLLKQELGPGETLGSGCLESLLLGMAGIRLPFAGAKCTVACALRP